MQIAWSLDPETREKIIHLTLVTMAAFTASLLVLLSPAIMHALASHPLLATQTGMATVYLANVLKEYAAGAK